MVMHRMPNRMNILSTTYIVALHVTIAAALVITRTCNVSIYLAQTHISAGLGHRFGSLLFGLDFAKSISAELFIDKDFWIGTPSSHGSYEWFGNIFDSFGLRYVNIRNERRVFSLSELKSEWHCDGVFTSKIDLGNENSCNGWCFESYGGVFARWCPTIQKRIRYDINKIVSGIRNNRNGTAGLIAVWHIRTGDVVLHVSEFFVQNVVRSLSLLTTPVSHVVLTENVVSLCDTMPHFCTGAFELQTCSAETCFMTLLQSDILISTGSSFAYAAACMSSPRRQVHVFAPPKESRGAKEPRLHGAWKTYFMTSSFPVSHNGTMYRPYLQKFMQLKKFIRVGTRSSTFAIPADFTKIYFEEPWNR